MNGGYTDLICGQCALEMGNKTLGVRRKTFSGEMAEHIRLLSLQWRKRNPEHKPVIAKAVPNPQFCRHPDICSVDGKCHNILKYDRSCND